ncbi:hypothetical protein [Bosea sp. BIWAKO-01]|uniref:hypothetical protein n=1 Tax=Bosea sp. BIWAKO-01 TaxID=506668 RepID=UPI00086C2E51|nr:hypothetical protein [Bosea sp. BIWAKO-01]GAU84012.1 hypothetical protein BIWAKO_03941 [Bosea sp. BIWAKO-01]
MSAFLLAAIAIDPYDTGRSPLSLKEGVRPQGPRTAAASRGRDPAFSGAIFGNSHIQLIKPEQLKALTGIPFVSLIAPATGPKETLVLIDWFLRHRREPAQALVIGIDQAWCTPDPALPTGKPFPFWLFSRNPAEYLTGLMRYDVLEEVNRRIRYLTTQSPERARPDGYWDYEEGYRVQGFLDAPQHRSKLLAPANVSGGNETGPFPAAAALAAFLDAEAKDTPVILVRPPVYVSALPEPGSSAERAEAACRAPFQALADNRPATKLVDLRRDTPLIREPSNFFDHTHYRQIVAREVETSIAAALTSLR